MVANHPSTDDGMRRDAPLSELIRSLASDVSLLVRKEAELATIEIRAKASVLRGAGLLLGAGLTVGLFAAGTMIAAAVLGLAIVLPAWAAALIVGVALLAIAAALVLRGRRRLRDAMPLMPTDTIETLQEDVAWVRTETERLHRSE